jgi:hypothetical protein
MVDELGKCYAADVLRKGDYLEAMNRLVDWVKNNPENASKRVTELEMIKDRCFISKKHLEYLQTALRGTHG